jgi:predicted permease
MLWPRLRSLVTSLRRRSQIENDMETELRFHIESRADDLMSRYNLTRQEALRRARLEYGAMEKYKEQSRAARGLRLVDELRQDVLYARRIFWRYPGFSLIAILSLAVGVGANTFVFSVANALLLRPLPIPSPEQIYSVDRNGSPEESFPNYRDIRDRNTVFSSLYMYRIAPVSLEDAAGPRRTWSYLVTGNYFQSLGIRPAIGRFFTPEEDRNPGESALAVLSYDCWQSRFGGNPAVVGQTVRINTRPFTVIGVAPKGFQGTEIFYWPELWMPVTMQAELEGFSWLERRSTHNAWIGGRLKSGVTGQQADENLKAIAAQLSREYPDNEGMRLTVSRPGLAGSLLRSPVSAFSTGVSLLAALVLLAACANIAILLSARLADRNRELAIRLSIGAARGRIVRQLLTESIVLSLSGGLAGIFVAAFLLRLLTHWESPLDFPLHFQVNPDINVFVFAFALSLSSGIVFGILPAFRAWQAAPAQGLKNTTASVPSRRWAVREVLLILQVAVCSLLVTSSLVAVRGLMHSLNMPLGFRPSGVAIVNFDLLMAGYDRENGRLFQRRTLEAIKGIPGIDKAAIASNVPLTLDHSSTRVFPVHTTDFRPSNATSVVYFYVSPDYFATMGTKLVAGREFTEFDTADSPPVAVVNETFARRVLQPGQWIGQRFTFGGKQTQVEVVGVVEDGKYRTLTEAPEAALFQPHTQNYSPTVLLLVRSSRPADQIAQEIRKALGELDPHLSLYGVGDLNRMLRLVFLPADAAMIALGVFGALAMLLALTGIHGLTSYTVARRTREIGIRVAVGARPLHVVRSVFGRTSIFIASGAAIGLIGGALSSKLLAAIVLGVSAKDPLVFVGTAVTMMLIGIAAAWKPIRRALRVDPLIALRTD